MKAAFRYGLTLLVLMNLVFVHITGAVGLAWLVPLYVLTFSAPVLSRMHVNVVYRSTWNLCVLVIFAILVVDAATTGPRHLLEDGLILAAFCQVHLLNVLQRQQKPDLLFFNSFLIALVTSFFCQDLVYSATFVVYAVVFLVTMHMSTLATRDHELPPEVLGLVIRDGLRRATVALGITALVFAFTPRDFQREGFVADQLLWRPGSQAEVDFSEQVQLGRSAHTTVSNRVVMNIQVLHGDRMTVPSHWRGATLPRYDGRSWVAEQREQVQHERPLDELWEKHRGDQWVRPAAGEQASVRVQYLSPVVRRLFTPLRCSEITIRPPAEPENAIPLIDGTFLYQGIIRPEGDTPGLVYEVAFDLAPPRAEGDPPFDYQLHEFKALGRTDVPSEAYDHLQRAVGSMPPDAPPSVVAEACRAYLAESFSYLLPGEQGAATDLGEFLAGGGSGGHCEYFATALAVMLRVRRIPCRVVTGFLAEEWDEDNRTLVVRARHAHAWVEVWDPERGWYVVDATPAAERGGDRASMFAGWRAWLEDLWQKITRFDAEDRRRAVAWLLSAPGRLFQQTVERPVHSLGTVAALVFLVSVWVRRRRRGRSQEVDAYLRAVRRSGLRRDAHETPRELLERARGSDLRPDRLNHLALATETHEKTRFGLP